MNFLALGAKFQSRSFSKPKTFGNVVRNNWAYNKTVFNQAKSFSTTSFTRFNKESFLNGTNSNLLESMYEEWKTNPSNVDPSWIPTFEAIKNNTPHGQIPIPERTSKFTQASGINTHSAADSLKVFLLIRSYRVLGHFLADLDPLNLTKASFSKIRDEFKRELDPANYGFTEVDMDREFFVGNELPGEKPVRTLREIIGLLKSVYCGHIGVQYMHAHDPAIKTWVKQKFENSQGAIKFSSDEKKIILKELIATESLEDFLAIKFKAKRFGLNGGESLMPGLETLVDEAANSGIENIIFGMPHRGRLNVMANVLQKPLVKLFNEFYMETKEGAELAGSVQGTGDVKYHIGTSADRVLPSGKKIHLSMTANPSHLEAVNPVVEGKTRAKQTAADGSVDFKKAMSVLIHGDAAFAGQGIVGETLELSGLDAFSTGGTIHIIVNNQIGFTTVPKYARTSPYPSEIAKASGVPIFHVNGDDPEAVVHVFKLALEFRNTFNKDSVIDMYCYRRFGHNELDEPRFTQPLMYSKIENHPTVAKIYGEKLEAEGSISKEVRKEYYDEAKAILQEGFNRRNEYKSVPADWLESHWKGFKSEKQIVRIKPTGVALENLEKVITALNHVPEGFIVNKTLLRTRFADFKRFQETKQGFNWGFGELLAYGTLLQEGYSVRLSGQDCERGTFSHRHAVLYDQESEKTYVQLANIQPNQGNFTVINSSLSENAVLGFEHGYSIENPNALVLWEAQFGDFANGAQVIIDQFISSGEQKWLRMSGLTMLLPHGYEGQGPEHSSARLERFLQLCDDHPDHYPADAEAATQKINLQVANLTTPANFYHILRRQLHREYRKPLVIMTPKYLLKFRLCVSSLEDFGPNSSFQRLIPDPALPNVKKARKIIFCSGKVYYDLFQERERLFPHGDYDIVFHRIEQIAPFPFDLVRAEAAKFPDAQVVWVQEEAMNQGSWTYVAPRLETALEYKRRPKYVGRDPSAAPATGLSQRHALELQEFLNQAFA